MTKDKGQSGKIVRVIFALLIVIVYFTGLTIPLLGPDEPRYAEVAREMFERHDWITPTLGGFDWFEKPALLYWLEIIAYKIFGITEFAARCGPALFGLGTVLSLWILGRFLTTESTENTEFLKLASESSGLSPAMPQGQTHRIQFLKSNSESSAGSVVKNDFAHWLGLIAASSIGLIVFSRGASFDIILTFPVTASLVSFFIFDLAQRRGEAERSNSKISSSIGSLLLFYFFIGIALIAKGLVGIVFPLAIVAFYYLLSRRRPSKAFVFSLFWGTFLSLLVASVWYLPMYRANGWKFIEEFFIEHHFQRFTSNKYQHPQPFYFFFWVLPLMTLPWLPFFFASLWSFFRVQGSRFKVQGSKGKIQDSKFEIQDSNDKIQESKFESQNSSLKTQDPELKPQNSENPTFSLFHFSPFSLSPPLLLFALSWLLVPLVFFSISGSKLPGYILPALPAALILTAEYIRRFVQRSRVRRIVIQIIAVSTLVGSAILAQFFIGDFLHEETVKHLIETANSEGYTNEKIVNLHTLSYSAEFYGAGRLVREADGKQKRFYGISEVVEEMKHENTRQILVLIPLEYQNQLTKDSNIESQILDQNGELAIASVKLK